MLRESAFALLLLGTATGCHGAMYNPELKQDLTRRASFDLNCPPADLTYTELSRADDGLIRSYGVRGCSRQAAYIL
ncbi:MAG: hypothetical protein HY898_28710 [Deltaproteobacteria bacterium]|nr:hypothetical protein [Deltaproteobacteria bacterium]